MAETKIYIPDSVDTQLREAAMKRFGYGRGSISRAVETAIVQWLAREQAINGAIEAVVEKAKKDNNVIAVLLFGSYAEKDPRFRDVDIALVVRDTNKSDFLAYDHAIEDIGALYTINVDVRMLNNMPIQMQSDVLDTAITLHVNDRDALNDYCLGVIRKEEDVKRIREILAG